MVAFFGMAPVNAEKNTKFVVLQDFEDENTNISDYVVGHEMFGGTSSFTSEKCSTWSIDGDKSVKITNTEGNAWEYKFFKVDLSNINASEMSAITMFIKTDDTMVNESGTQFVAKFGFWTSEEHLYFGTDIGHIYDKATNQFLPTDYTHGQGKKDMIWFNDAQNKEIAIKIPLANPVKNPDGDSNMPDLDPAKITHIMMVTSEPATGKSMLFDRIVGIEGKDDGSTGFAPIVDSEAPEVVDGLFMLQDFEEYKKDDDLLLKSALTSIPNKDGAKGTAKASDIFSGIEGVSAKIDYPDEVLSWSTPGAECAFKAPLQQYGSIKGMNGVIFYVKMPKKSDDIPGDIVGFKIGIEGPKGENGYVVFGLENDKHVRVLNTGEEKWRYLPVSDNNIYLPENWEGYIQIPFSQLVVTYPKESITAKVDDSDYTPLLYGYVENIGGNCGPLYLDDIMVYAPQFDLTNTKFKPSDWISRKGEKAGTINLPSDTDISVEDVLDQINNSDIKEIIITLNEPTSLPKEILVALKDKDKNLIIAINSGEATLYSWIINGKDVTDVSKDFETNVLINGSIYQDAITELTEFLASKTCFISTAADYLPGKMLLKINTGALFSGKVNVYLYDTNEESVRSIAESVSVIDESVTFPLSKGGEYFISSLSYTDLGSEKNNNNKGENKKSDDEKLESPKTGYITPVIVTMLFFVSLAIVSTTIKRDKKRGV